MFKEGKKHEKNQVLLSLCEVAVEEQKLDRYSAKLKIKMQEVKKK